ncbi:MAG: BNR repeat-containing protein [Opitutae bacterium]|nr:BNR repeat-containing protein [Opitutae bacterium]
MNAIRLILLLLGLLALPRNMAAGNADGILIDQVWAGHPVPFALLTERGHQFIAYYAADRRITVAGRKLDGNEWTRICPEGRSVPGRDHSSNAVGWDTHNSLQLALDRDGCLHLSGNMHADPLVYYRTRVPFDVSTLERIDRMTGEHENKVTYPDFFKNRKGDLLFRYRNGGSGDGSDYYNIYDSMTRTWRRFLNSPLHDGEGERNAYATTPILGPDGRFHVLWVWRETPDAATNHSLSYARSPDLIHWETSVGRPITLPITLAKSDVIDNAKPSGGLINMVRVLGFDPQGQPLAAYHRYDAAGNSQAYIARPRPTGGWDICQLSDWKFRWAFAGGGSIDADVSLGSPQPQKNGTVLVDYSTKVAGSGRFLLNGETLSRLANLPPAPSVIPHILSEVQSSRPGLFVQLQTQRAGECTWVLRWETQGRNRDKQQVITPPPSELRLYQFPDRSDSLLLPP